MNLRRWWSVVLLVPMLASAKPAKSTAKSDDAVARPAAGKVKAKAPEKAVKPSGKAKQKTTAPATAK